MLRMPNDGWFRTPTLAGSPGASSILSAMGTALGEPGPFLANHPDVQALENADQWYRARAARAYLSATRGKIAWLIGVDTIIVGTLALIGYPTSRVVALTLAFLTSLVLFFFWLKRNASFRGATESSRGGADRAQALARPEDPARRDQGPRPALRPRRLRRRLGGAAPRGRGRSGPDGDDPQGVPLVLAARRGAAAQARGPGSARRRGALADGRARGYRGRPAPQARRCAHRGGPAQVEGRALQPGGQRRRGHAGRRKGRGRDRGDRALRSHRGARLRARHAARGARQAGHAVLHHSRRGHRPGRGGGAGNVRPARRIARLFQRTGAGNHGGRDPAGQIHHEERGCPGCCWSMTSRRCSSR